MDKIIMKNMEFYGYHGVLIEEQIKGQNFYIDLEMYLDLKKAGNNDNLEDTVDYSKIYDIIKYITENYKFRLIEKLADSISREILSKYEMIKEVVVCVKKPDAPISGTFDFVGVEIKRKKDGV